MVLAREHVSDNNYSRLYTHSFHCCRETKISRLEVNFAKVNELSDVKMNCFQVLKEYVKV